MASIITASDGVNFLLRNGRVAHIGLIHDLGIQYLSNGRTKCVKMIELDFENDSVKDYWYFSEDGLEFNFVDPRRGPFMKNIYKEATRAKDINTFLNCVVSSYTAWQMGFV